MRKTAHILYINYLSPDGERVTVGGIQTYIDNLSDLLREMGYEIRLYQRATSTFHKRVNEMDVYGIKGHSRKARTIGAELFRECRKHFNREHDLLIFGSDDYICNTDGIPFVAIQHGITWDIPRRVNKYLGMLKKFYRGCLVVNRVGKASILVCVDNNFINWYRATVTYPEARTVNIPNFAQISPEIQKPGDGKVRVIFARRLFPYRGTRIFGHAVRHLLSEFDNLEVTIAGEGPDEEWLREQFRDCPAVKFIVYSSSESLQIHCDKDIAVVPTLGSEGTSLSLLEAMSAQCAVVCTNVGGMTDIVLDGYNGLIINPDEDSLYESLRSLIIDENLRRRLAANGYSVVKDCFSKDIWKKRWRGVLENFVKQA
ncbi:MAG: glycosyltransferase family 4 protein [Bacteroides sp.]|nr:glycosyltransferase family 4 protein [Bacteroides sp.]